MLGQLMLGQLMNSIKEVRYAEMRRTSFCAIEPASYDLPALARPRSRTPPLARRCSLRCLFTHVPRTFDPIPHSSTAHLHLYGKLA